MRVDQKIKNAGLPSTNGTQKLNKKKKHFTFIVYVYGYIFRGCTLELIQKSDKKLHEQKIEQKPNNIPTYKVKKLKYKILLLKVKKKFK